MGNKWIDSKEAVRQNSVVQVSDYATVVYSSEAQVKIGDFPKGALLLYHIVEIETTFNDSGTDLLLIGTAGTADAFETDFALSQTGSGAVYVTAILGATMKLTADTAVYCNFNGENNNASAGKAYVAIMWVPTWWSNLA